MAANHAWATRSLVVRCAVHQSPRKRMRWKPGGRMCCAKRTRKSGAGRVAVQVTSGAALVAQV